MVKSNQISDVGSVNVTEKEKNQRIAELEVALAALRAHIAPQPPFSPSEEALEAAKRMNPLDDLFFTKMAEDASVCDEVISTILNMRSNLSRVFTSVISQKATIILKETLNKLR